MTNKTAQCEYYIEGMHCPACEVLIEKKLKEDLGATSVKASLSENKVTFNYNDEHFNLEKANKILKEFGYKLITEKNNKVSSRKGILIGLLVLGVVTLILSFGHGLNFSVNSASTLPAFFIFGIVASLSSCAALVGGVLLALSKQWSSTYSSKSFTPYILFNVGRILSFFILGGLLGLLGNVIGLSTVATSFIVILVSVYMVVVGMQQLGIKWFDKFRISYPKFISDYAANEKNFIGKYLPLLSGALTFFIPCGFTIVAQGIAITSGSFITGALIMGSFVLGTTPSLSLISYSSVKFRSKPAFASKFSYIAGVLILFFGVFSLNSQLNALGLPSLSDVNLSSIFSPMKDFVNLASGEVSETKENSVGNNNTKQVVQIEANGFAYTPRSIEIKSGVPTRLEIINKGAVGCANSLVGRGLFQGVLTLQDGLNVVEFTPQMPGNYKITCSMGMVPPVNVKVI